jgi:DNA replication protein DnaC
LKFYEKKLPKICEFDDISFVHTGGIRQKLHSILFEGNIGSGKTFIASVMVQSSLKKGYPAKYYDWSDLVSYCSDYNKKTELDEIVEEFKALEFVAIDGIEMYAYSSPMTAQNIDRLCKARLNSGKPTMLFCLGNVAQIQGGTGWLSLTNKCITIRLPSL